ITVSHNKSADFRRYSTLLFEVFSYKQTMGEEGKIHVDGSVGETTGLRWPARATSASAPVPTTGNAVLPCRAIRSDAPGGAAQCPASKQSPSSLEFALRAWREQQGGWENSPASLNRANSKYFEYRRGGGSQII